jgi:hypothetical protein
VWGRESVSRAAEAGQTCTHQSGALDQVVVFAVRIEPEPLSFLLESPQVCRLGECTGLARLLLLLLAFAFLAFLPALVGEPPEFCLSALLGFFGCLFGDLTLLFLFREFGLLLRRVGRRTLEQIGKLRTESEISAILLWRP